MAPKASASVWMGQYRSESLQILVAQTFKTLNHKFVNKEKVTKRVKWAIMSDRCKRETKTWKIRTLNYKRHPLKVIHYVYLSVCLLPIRTLKLIKFLTTVFIRFCFLKIHISFFSAWRTQLSKTQKENLHLIWQPLEPNWTDRQWCVETFKAVATPSGHFLH